MGAHRHTQARGLGSQFGKLAQQTGRQMREGGGSWGRGWSLWEGAPLGACRSSPTCTARWRQRRTGTCVSVITDVCAHSVSQLRWARGPGARTVQPLPRPLRPVLPGEAVGSLRKGLTPGPGRGPVAPRMKEGLRKHGMGLVRGTQEPDKRGRPNIRVKRYALQPSVRDANTH